MRPPNMPQIPEPDYEETRIPRPNIITNVNGNVKT